MPVCIPLQTQFITQAKYKVATYILYFHNKCDTTFTASQKDSVVNNYVNPQFNTNIGIKNDIMSLGTSICDNRTDQESKARSIACVISGKYNLACNCTSSTAINSCSLCKAQTPPPKLVTLTGTATFRIQLNQLQHFKQSAIYFAAPTNGKWCLVAATLKVVNAQGSCGGPFHSYELKLQGSIYKGYNLSTRIDYGETVGADYDEGQPHDTPIIYLNGNTTITPAQIVAVVGYSTSQACIGPDDVEGNVICTATYAPCNGQINPGSPPSVLKNSNSTDLPIPPGKCNILVPTTWCDCTGIGPAGMTIPGFGNLGCDTVALMLGGAGLLILLTLIRR